MISEKSVDMKMFVQFTYSSKSSQLWGWHPAPQPPQTV
ncbi:hypothetical protein C943_02721 [Mariniradius saccharolyticus AK6]|uniref:Uncharacterized protein n=1 Tax=Mariniradius saccharolyticus AK6 TaxID=1239962 RepID=M7X892_9BACT|nr:hypothetical protein C943_02721 [Mariniradius saccharolyticus AK6]